MSPAAESSVRSLPDVASHPQTAAAPLDWVGMGEIELPLLLPGPGGAPVQVAARAAAFVNLLRPDARGIHMSRLYLEVERALGAEPLSPGMLRRVLKTFVETHAELSDRAMLRLRFEQLVRRPALASANSGWRAYPVTVTGVYERGQFSLELALEVLYSSTCPASAALARQLIQQRFQQDFPAGEALDHAAVLRWLGSEQGICATPHSQRSRAEVKLRLLPSFQGLPTIDLIDRIEAALATPVQTAVKREDEQAFARLNGENLMFCEDAARRIHAVLDADERVVDFWLRATHYESLHPHNAVAVASKGVAGGYVPG